MKKIVVTSLAAVLLSSLTTQAVLISGNVINDAAVTPGSEQNVAVVRPQTFGALTAAAGDTTWNDADQGLIQAGLTDMWDSTGTVVPDVTVQIAGSLARLGGWLPNDGVLSEGVYENDQSFTLTFGGLTPSTPYELAVFSSLSYQMEAAQLNGVASAQAYGSDNGDYVDMLGADSANGTFWYFSGTVPVSGELVFTDVGSTSYNTIVGFQMDVVAVPEPATLGLLGLAFGGLVMIRKRRK